MGRIFISYRRADTAADAGRLYESLSAVFGPEALFKDVDDIAYGDDFRRSIESAIAGSDVLVLVIGPDWLAHDAGGRPRIARAVDAVRLELLEARAHDVAIVPLTVRGATMPDADDLPAELEWLSYVNAAELDHGSWGRDLAPVIDDLKELIARRGERRARAFVESTLARGPRMVEDVRCDAKAEGIDRKALDAAVASLGVRREPGVPSGMRWALAPRGEPEPPAKPEPVGRPSLSPRRDGTTRSEPESPDASPSARGFAVGAAIVAVILAVVAGVFVLGRGGDDGQDGVVRTPATTVEIDVAGAEGIALDGGTPWVSTASGLLARIDPATNRVASSVPVDARNPEAELEPSRVAVGDGIVWVTGEGFVNAVDARTATVVRRVRVPGARPSDVAVGEGGCGSRSAGTHASRASTRVRVRSHGSSSISSAASQASASAGDRSGQAASTC